MAEQVSLEASEAIRIAETFFPNDLSRQRDLAREIVKAINLCHADFAQEIFGIMNAA